MFNEGGLPSAEPSFEVAETAPGVVAAGPILRFVSVTTDDRLARGARRGGVGRDVARGAVAGAGAVD